MNVTRNLTGNLFLLNSLYKYFQTQRRTDVSVSRGICLDCDIFQWLQYFTSPSPTPNIPILSKARKQWAKVEPGQSVLCFIMGTRHIRHGDNLGSWLISNVNLKWSSEQQDTIFGWFVFLQFPSENEYIYTQLIYIVSEWDFKSHKFGELKRVDIFVSDLQQIDRAPSDLFVRLSDICYSIMGFVGSVVT